VNFLTAHDGFTLHDLVSYNDKHNEANGEDNNDGHNDNRSYNYGAEGETEDDGIVATRERQKRNFLATLLLSHGTPMILAGDEFGRTQGGNNNGYAQDSEISWVHWDLGENASALTAFVQQVIAIRNAQPLLRRENWRDQMSVTWINTSGGEQQAAHWLDAGATTLGVRFARDDLKGKDGGIWWEALILFNPHDGDVPFTLPERDGADAWRIALDTATPNGEPRSVPAGTPMTMTPRSLLLLH
jgi:glycogen operon protein